MLVNNGWSSVSLGEILTRNWETTAIEPTARYRQVTIRLWGKGVISRGETTGLEIAGTCRFVVRAGQFILSRIDARNGAFGLVPDELDGAIATNDFPSFTIEQSKLAPKFLGWLSRTEWFVQQCRAASEGTTNRVRLKEDRFLHMRIALPNRSEQDRIVARIDAVAGKIEEAKQANSDIAIEAAAMLRSAFDRITSESPRMPLAEVAPIVRRHVDVCMGGEYPELGIRSFGKGTFHKPALDFLAVGTKKLYRIEPGDLVFNNVFAWEGAIAVAQPEDAGRVGSHRFITCVPQPGVATAGFLCFYLLTPEGLEKIREASPGGAGRNRTLGLEKLMRIEVPIPPFERQLWFDRLQGKVREMLAVEQEIDTDLDSMLPSVLDRAFKGAL